MTEPQPQPQPQPQDQPSIYDLIRAVRQHPDARAVVVFTAGDCEDPDDLVEWSNVEDRMTERGWDAIEFYVDLDDESQ